MVDYANRPAVLNHDVSLGGDLVLVPCFLGSTGHVYDGSRNRQASVEVLLLWIHKADL